MGIDTKSLLIGGTISIVVLVISIGMFVFYSASGNSQEALEKMTQQEVSAFNGKFLLYEGVQDGTIIRNLIAQLITNSSTYGENDFKRLPEVIVNTNNTLKKYAVEDAIRPTNEDEISDYIKKLTKIRSAVKAENEFLIEFEYLSNGLIDKINILEVIE